MDDRDHSLPPSGNGDGVKPWEPRELSEAHRRIIELHAAGMTNGDIAAALNYSSSRVSVVLNSAAAQMYKQFISERTSLEAVERLRRLQGRAVETIDGRMVDEHEKGSVRLRAATEVLDRTGVGRSQHVDHRHELVIPDHVANLLHETAKMLAGGTTHDAEYTVEPEAETVDG